MRTVVVFAVGLLAASPLCAQSIKEGWGFQFRQDTFDQTVFPLAMMSENGDGFDKALLAVACGKGGGLVSFFQSGRVSFDRNIKVQLRSSKGAEDFSFSEDDVPNLGPRVALSEAETSKLLEIFEQANGADVPFRAGAKQGSFGTIAAAQTFSIMKQNCPKA